MSTQSAIEILKNAILLEMRGETFYRTVAQTTEDEAVREFFELMADEEAHHQEILSGQLKSLGLGSGFSLNPAFGTTASHVADKVLSATVQERIGAASFEAAAITAAIAMERGAVSLYGARAEATDDPEERRLYSWLTTWEQNHHDELVEMDRALREAAWNDAGFFPY